MKLKDLTLVTKLVAARRDLISAVKQMDGESYSSAKLVYVSLGTVGSTFPVDKHSFTTFLLSEVVRAEQHLTNLGVEIPHED